MIGLTLTELAEKIGISRTTVSRVMSGNAKKYRISAATEKKVKDAALKYGLVPNRVAQNLRLQRTDTIGLLIPNIANPFFANLASVIEDELRKYNKLILLCNTNESTSQELEALSVILGKQTDGLLVAPVGLEGLHFKPMEGKKIVFIDRYFKDLNIPHVSTNNEVGAYTAAKYLLERGHRNICCIQGLKNTISNQDRIAGFLRANKEFDNEANIEILGNGFSIENGRNATLEILKKNHLPTAIFTLSNQIAIGALEALNSHGVSIPNDISLISFDDQPYFSLMSPPITAVKQPVEEIARTAVQKLMEVLEDKVVDSVMIKPKIIERKSISTLK